MQLPWSPGSYHCCANQVHPASNACRWHVFPAVEAVKASTRSAGDADIPNRGERWVVSPCANALMYLCESLGAGQRALGQDCVQEWVVVDELELCRALGAREHLWQHHVAIALQLGEGASAEAVVSSMLKSVSSTGARWMSCSRMATCHVVGAVASHGESVSCLSGGSALSS